MRLSQFLFLTGLSLSSEASYGLACSVSQVQAVNFGTVDPLSATDVTAAMTFNYTCSRSVTDLLAGVTLCFNIGSSSVSGQVNSRKMSLSGAPASFLDYQLYQDPGYNTVWGSQYQAGTTSSKVKLNFLGVIPVMGSQTIYARIPASQISAAPGSYQDNYSSVNASVTLNTGLVIPPVTCGTTAGPTFPFTVLVTLAKQCKVSYANNINLGTVDPTQANISANNTIGVTCTNNTPYTIGLIPSNSNTSGSGMMNGSNWNSNQVPYQLRAEPGLSGSPWGNTKLNNISGIGSGSTVTKTVYVTIPGANYIPDTYADTVTVNVSY